MSIFKRKSTPEFVDSIEERFQKVVDLVWDLDRVNFKRLIEGIDLVYKGYDKVRTVQTTEEKVAEAEDKEGLGEYMDVKQ